MKEKSENWRRKEGLGIPDERGVWNWNEVEV